MASAVARAYFMGALGSRGKAPGGDQALEAKPPWRWQGYVFKTWTH